MFSTCVFFLTRKRHSVVLFEGGPYFVDWTKVPAFRLCSDVAVQKAMSIHVLRFADEQNVTNLLDFF